MFPPPPPELTWAELLAQPGYTGMAIGIDDIIIAVVVIMTVANMALSIAATAKGPPKGPRPESIDDFQAPTADDGRPVPVVFGEVLVTGPNVVWYGDLSWTERKKEGQVVGYRYFMGMHLAICCGPVDAVTKFVVGDRVAWSGNATSSQTVTVTSGGLFGGDDGEGGVSGDVEIRFGGPNQSASPYLSRPDILDTQLAFRGVLSLVLKGNNSLPGFEPDSGFYVGTVRYIKPWAVRVLRKPGRTWNAGTESWDRWYEAKSMVGTEGNPAHIIYEVLTNADWGMGYPTAIIDDTRFRAAADTLHAEGTGLGFVWVQQTSIQEFLQQIMDHINAVLRLDPVTGTFFLKLIRDDYVTASLPLLNESNILELESFQRTGWGETVNEVVVKYRGVNGKPKSVTVQNLANVQIQGRAVSETKDYPGIRTNALAKRIAARDLRTKSAGLAAVRLRCNRQAHALGPGDCFRFAWPDLDIAEMVMRVGQVSGGTLVDGAITIVAAQDIFGLGDEVFSEIDPEEWVQPDPVPDPSTFPPAAAPSGLAATSGYQLITWSWTATEPGAKTELWVSQTNDRATAERVYADYGTGFDQQAVGGATWYGWIRAIDSYGNYSEWSPVSATGGVLGTAGDVVPGLDDLSDRITVLESGGGGGGNTDNLWTRVEFSTPGAYSWEVPDGIAQIWLTAQAGGGGGEAANSERNANGGGAGAWVYRRLVSVTPGATITGTVGAGGAGGTAPLGAGSAGGNTTFGVLTFGGGLGGGDDTPGAGGTTSTGQSGGDGAARGGDNGGRGGDGLFPGGGWGGNTNHAAGQAGRLGGGGGGGGINNSGSGGRGGDAGGDGFILIEYQPAAGAQGPAGPQGDPGPAGEDGLSAYEVAVSNGFEGSEEEWLESLVGPPGETGEGGGSTLI